jgi:ribonuclease HI
VGRLQFTKETNKFANNIAKYEALLLGLRKLQAKGVQNYILRTDSKVIPRQIKNECIARNSMLERYLALVRWMENYIRGFSVEHIDWSKNIETDELAKATTRKAAQPPDVFFQTLKDSSLKIIEPEPRTVNVIQGKDWRALIMP